MRVNPREEVEKMKSEVSIIKGWESRDQEEQEKNRRDVQLYFAQKGKYLLRT